MGLQQNMDEQVNQHLTRLDLSHNEMAGIPVYFGDLTGLGWLNLSSNDIFQIDCTFERMRSLRVVNISRNPSISAIPQSMADHPSLKVLKAGFCGITSFPEMSETSSLEILILSGNNIHHIPESVRYLKELRVLNLGDFDETCSKERSTSDTNPINDLPDAITELSNLKTLNLSGTYIKSLPVHIGKLKRLKRLCLNTGRFGQLPASIGDLSRLKMLSCASCRTLASLPDTIGSLKRLRVLVLNESKSLEDLGEKIWDCSSLRVLSVCNGNLSVNPTGIANLTNLRVLELTGGSITKLPSLVWRSTVQESDAVHGLVNLKVLAIGNDLLSTIRESIGRMRTLKVVKLFNHTPTAADIKPLRQLSLKELHMYDCDVGPSNIGDLTSLEYLKIRSGELKSIPMEFSKLVNLKRFEIERLKIKSFFEVQFRAVLQEDCGPENRQPKQLAGVLDGLRCLRELELKSCNLRELPASVGNLKSLVSLRLTSLRLKVLPEFIGQLYELTELDVSNNSIAKLPESICDLTNLLKLKASDCKLRELPSGIGKLQNMKICDLANNPLEILSDDFGDLQNLTELYINNTRINDLSGTIDRLTSLKVLHFYDRNVSEAQMHTVYKGDMTNSNCDISGLVNLKECKLGRIQLTELPTNIENLRRLESLNVSSNEITKLPPGFVNLISLKTLYLTSNNISELPEDIGSLSRLEVLILNSNKLTALPESIRKLKYLSELGISENRFEVVSDAIFDLENLRTLNLSENSLSILPELVGGSKLIELSMGLNKFTEIPGAVYKMEKLCILGASYNQIASISPAISNLTNLCHIDLEGNVITSVPYEVVATRKSLVHLEVIENPLDLVGTESHMGKFELKKIWNKLTYEWAKTRTESEYYEANYIIEDDVYARLDSHRLGWNRDRLRALRVERVPSHTLTEERILEIWDQQIEPAIINKEEGATVRGCITRIYHPDIKEEKENVIEVYFPLAKDMIEGILLLLTNEQNITDHDKIRSHIGGIADAARYCIDRLMSELRFSYYTLHGRTDPSASLKSFVENYVSTAKEDIFDSVVTCPSDKQNVHTNMFWKYQMRDRLGFDFGFDSELYGVDEVFHYNPANVIDAFYRSFTPRRIIWLLTDAINTNKVRMCEALQLISELDLSEDAKSRMFVSEGGGIDFAIRITDGFSRYYLELLGIIVKPASNVTNS